MFKVIDTKQDARWNGLSPFFTWKWEAQEWMAEFLAVNTQRNPQTVKIEEYK